MKTYRVLHLFCGAGGGAIGFQRAERRLGDLRGRFRSICGIDNDAAACRDFTALTGAPGVCADLSKMTSEELRDACGGERPDVIFTSPPCKGFSGLLSSARLAEEKYQALNRLVFQGLWLVLETWPEHPPKLIVLENVPRIATRGAHLLVELRGLLARYGYRFHEGFHDCGEVGGLAQHRNRFLLVARHERQVPTFVYRPPHRRVRAIGEVLGELPLPGDPRGGPMHALPRLEWLTWLRLALIPAGGDWRALGRKSDGPWHRGAYGVVPWSSSSGVVTGGGRPANGAFSVADPRLPPGRYNNVFRIVKWEDPSVAITGGGTPTSGGVCVADPRFTSPGSHEAKHRIERWEAPAHTVTGADRIGSGAPSVADPRFTYPESTHHNVFRVRSWEEPAGVITGASGPNAGAVAVADPRLSQARGGAFGVVAWERPAGTVTGEGYPSNGAFSVADPRINGKGSRPDLFGVLRWDGPAKTISGQAQVSGSNCPAAVADPRVGCAPRAGGYGVAAWSEPTGAVVGAADIHAGRAAVADPRIPGEREILDPPPIIIALDGTWHRPLTTLELAALQGFPVFDDAGAPLQLDGRSHSKWRERIGNAVPPPAAEVVAGQLLDALLATDAGFTFTLGGTDVWVQPEVLAL